MGQVVMLLALAVSWLPLDFAAKATTYKGTVTGVQAAAIAILDQNKENQSFPVADDAKITLNGKPAKLSDIEIGDVAKLATSTRQGKEVVTAIEANDAE